LYFTLKTLPTPPKPCARAGSPELVVEKRTNQVDAAIPPQENTHRQKEELLTLAMEQAKMVQTHECIEHSQAFVEDAWESYATHSKHTQVLP